MFGPSRFFSGTMASADFLRFVVTAHFLPCVRKTSPGTHTFFPSLPAAFTVSDSVQLLGFILSWKLALAYGLICDFYSSGQRFAAAFLQILPHGRHPWLKLYPSRCRADSGLSPFRTCAHRAHTKKSCDISSHRTSFFSTSRSFFARGRRLMAASRRRASPRVPQASL